MWFEVARVDAACDAMTDRRIEYMAVIHSDGQVLVLPNSRSWLDYRRYGLWTTAAIPQMSSVVWSKRRRTGRAIVTSMSTSNCDRLTLKILGKLGSFLQVSGYGASRFLPARSSAGKVSSRALQLYEANGGQPDKTVEKGNPTLEADGMPRMTV